MENTKNLLDRRSFLGTSTTALTAGLAGLAGLYSHKTYSQSSENDLFVIGPIEGYSPLIGTLVSMLNYNRQTVIELVQSLTIEQLDYLHDPKANTIGALLLHLGATDKFYQINTFEGRQAFNEAEQGEWQAAMALGDLGRERIKGQSADHYIDIITEVRRSTLDLLKTKDDEWLLKIDPVWSETRPLNTFWKWFHVCEHEANHRGQIAWLISRLP